MPTTLMQVAYRPVRVAWLVRGRSKNDLRDAFRLASCLWGGMFGLVADPASDGDIDGAIGRFRVDVLHAITDTDSSRALVERNGHLAWPSVGGGIVRGDHSEEPGLLDMSRALRLRARRERSTTAVLPVWEVRDHGGETTITFAHIKRFPYAKLRDYLAILQLQPTEIVWDRIKSTKIDQPNRVKLLQIADLTAGCLYSAVNPDDYGDHEPSYLLELAPRIYVRGSGRVTSYGMNIVGPPSHMDATYPWWPSLINACENRVKV